MAEAPAGTPEPPHPWRRPQSGPPSGELTVEWTPPDGEVIAPGAFAGSIGKPVRVNSPTGTQIGTLVSVEVRQDGRFARLTIRAGGEWDPR